MVYNLTNSFFDSSVKIRKYQKWVEILTIRKNEN